MSASTEKSKSSPTSPWSLSPESRDVLFIAEKRDSRVYAFRHAATIFYLEDIPVSYKRRAFKVDVINDALPVLHALIRAGWDIQVDHVSPQ